MYGVILRAGALLVGGSLLMIPFMMAGNAMTSEVASIGPDGSPTAQHMQTVVDWMPGIVIVVTVVILISGAALRRGGR